MPSHATELLRPELQYGAFALAALLVIVLLIVVMVFVRTVRLASAALQSVSNAVYDARLLALQDQQSVVDSLTREIQTTRHSMRSQIAASEDRLAKLFDRMAERQIAAVEKHTAAMLDKMNSRTLQKIRDRIKQLDPEAAREFDDLTDHGSPAE